MDRQADARALFVDQVGCGCKANEFHGVSSEQQLRREQRTVGGAKDQDSIAKLHMPVYL